MTESLLPLISNFVSVGAIGYFLWTVREMRKEMTDTRDAVRALVGEHNLYKELNLCPLVRGMTDKDGQHIHIRKDD